MNASEIMRLNTKSVNLELNIESKKLLCNGSEVPFSVRRLGDMSPVLLSANLINKNNRDDVLYYMYRAAGLSVNPTIFEAHNMRYDVTMMVNYNLGKEFNKTFGHYHPLAENDLSYPEIYELLYGEAMYVLQAKQGDEYKVRLVRAKKGDRIIMPPNYGHITVNVGNGPLVEANLVSSKFKSDYMPIKDMGGGAVYVLNDNNIVVNKNYSNVSIGYFEEPEELAFLDNSKSLYDEYIAHPEHFEFLEKPSLLAGKITQ